MSEAIRYSRSGKGEPLLLVHGIGGDRCVWEPVIDHLADRYDVIAVDLPGFGRSPALAPEVVPTPRALADALHKLTSALAIPAAHVVGNSLGGWVALEFAASGRARSVTALCPAGLWAAPLSGPDAPDVRNRGQRLARRLRPILGLLLLSRRLRRLALTPFLAHPERVPYRAAVRMIASYGRATAYEATNTAMRRDRFRGLGAVQVPVTLAFGDRDRLIRPVRLQHPGAETVVLGGCGHVPMWDDPDTVVAVIDRTAARAAGSRGPTRA